MPHQFCIKITACYVYNSYVFVNSTLREFYQLNNQEKSYLYHQIDCMKKIFFLVFNLILSSIAFAQSAREVAVELYAEVKSSGVDIKWKSDANALKYYIYKRSNPKVDWLLIDSVSGTTNLYNDPYFSGIKPVEYRVAKKSSSYSFYGNGYISVGNKIPAKAKLGKVLMIIDSNYSVPLKSNISEYKDQLTREGWEVVSKVVLRNDSVTKIKSWIKSQWISDSANIKSIFLLGHVPVPYSGNYRPDGHIDHTGAWPADMYYGNFYSNWSDNAVNNTQASYTRNQNIPNDGKFDISRVNPIGTAFSAIQYAQIPVGRVDLFNMTSFGNDTFLTKRYLNKALKFRRGQHKAVSRGLIDDNFGYFSSEAFASGGFRNFCPQFKDSIVEADYRTTMKNQSYLMSYGCGAGTYTGCSGVASSYDFVSDSLLNPFTMMFGSYFGDWDNQDNMLRAPLASKGWGLANVWSGRPYWMLHECALGLPLGAATLTSVNSYYFYNAAAFQSGVHTALMGDPTLTLYPLASLSNAQAIAKCTDVVRFRWDLHSDNVDSVIIEENIGGVWKLVGRAVGSDTSFSKKTTVGAHLYSIRPLKLMSSASGTWWQLGARVYAKVSVNVQAKAIAITSTKNACVTDSVIVAELKFGNTPKYTRSWFVNGVLNQDTSVSFKSVFEVGPIVVKMRLTTDSGCVYFDSVKFQIHALPIAKPKFVSGKSVCLGENLIMKSESKGNQFWIIGSDTIGKADDVTFKSVAAGSYARLHFIKDSMGCSNIYYDTFVVYAAANAGIVKSPDSLICLGGTYVVSASDTANSLVWKLRYSLRDTTVFGTKSLLFKEPCSLKLVATTSYGCMDSSYLPVYFHQQPKKLKISVVKPAVYPGDTIILAVHPNATWPKNNFAVWTKPVSSNDSLLKYKVSDTGLLVFEVKSMNNAGCQSDTTIYSQYFGPSSVGQFQTEKIEVYPNPNEGAFIIKTTQVVKSLKVYDVAGQIIDVETHDVPQSKNIKIQLTEVQKGVYLVQGVYENGMRFVSKVVIR